MRSKIICFLFVALCFWGAIHLDAAPSLDPTFIALVNGSASVKYFKVAMPGDLFIVNDKPVVGDVFFEGSVQPDTFWIRNCTNSPADSGSILPGWITGMSYKEYWVYRDPQVTIAPRESKIMSPMSTRALQNLSTVRQAFGLGMTIQPGSFEVAPDNTFKALATDTNASISGHFEVGANGFPTRCEYSSHSIRDAKVTVTYGYDGSNETGGFPTKITVQLSRLSIEVEKDELKVLRLELGVVRLPLEGYTVDYMTNFGGVNLTTRNILGTMVVLNGTNYLMSTNGTMTMVNRDVAAQAQMVQQHRSSIIVVLCALIILPVLFLARKVLVTNHNKQKHT